MSSERKLAPGVWHPISAINDSNRYAPSFLLHCPDLVCSDFNPSGVVEGHWCDDEGWQAAVWCGYHDEFHTKFVTPTLVMTIPSIAAPQPPAEPVVWGAPKTVGQLIRQLQTLDSALETVALYRLPDDIPGVGGKVKQGHISISYERMEGIWLGPYKGDGRKVLAFWTKLDPRPVPDGELMTQTPPLGDIYESHAIVAAAYKQLLSALGNEEMSHSDALAAICAKPATAKVVLPERKFGSSTGRDQWNACLDEVARLNGGQS
ncbi:hypothetical protein LCG56_26675 [Pseudomonas cannabina pv. alisalensis]|uniref:hypothetical protein n=1 Tax=Pseudomonas syringae group TaxID=136849 RepID=UPI000209282C|nr:MULTISPECIES: hypothetical protein [Pseudomonas syringae group]UBY97472.1 hypothetical protein LCG56_26675 [Pseudomonas cannabina pv. alisalensis]